MAPAIWRTGRRLDECLFSAAYQFDFFEAMRLLTRDCEAQHAPGIRFRVQTATAFPASAVVRVERPQPGEAPLMTVSFLGLIGASGTLPAHYTDHALEQAALGDNSYAAFFDIFHQRLLWLFYRAWEKHHVAVGHEQASLGRCDGPRGTARPGTRDALTRYLLCLIGMGSAGLERKLPFPDEALLRYAGLLAQRPRSAECLRALLADYFAVPVVIEQFLGRWHPLATDELCALGSGEQSAQLGRGAVAGEAVWSRQAMLRAVLGPLSAERFFSFLPAGDAFRSITALTRWFLGPGMDFAIQPMIASGEVPAWCCLGQADDEGPQLGWSSWLQEEAFSEPAADAVFQESEQA